MNFDFSTGVQECVINGKCTVTNSPPPLPHKDVNDYLTAQLRRNRAVNPHER